MNATHDAPHSRLAIGIVQARREDTTHATQATTLARREVPAATAAALAAIVLLVLIYVGSRGLRDFDAALVGYAVGSVFALATVVYRYTVWITRPPTWRYWKAGWTNFLSWRNFLHYTALIPVAWWTDIFAQTFILKRSRQRWIMHMSIFWGVVLSCCVTFPLTFGWIHFTL
ncbi:MAG TPA: MFS transporter, partial [Chloroflexota bacterium]